MCKIIIHSILLFCLISIISCAEEVEAPKIEGQIVVESYLRKGQDITLTLNTMLPYDGSGEAVKTLDDATVIINDGTANYTMTAKGNGTYFLDKQQLAIETGKTYKMSLEYKGQKVEATTIIPTQPENFKSSDSEIITPNIGGGSFPTFPDPIKLTWTNLKDAYYLIVSENTETNPESIFGATGFEPPRFRTEPLQANGYELSFRNFSYKGNHLIILYHINPDYASLYEQNGSNSLNLSNVPSNVTGGLGIFTGVATDTLKIQVK
jgi:Domain of unknown function (DUF4249)